MAHRRTTITPGQDRVEEPIHGTVELVLHKGEWRLNYLGWAGLAWSRGPRGARFLALHSQCGGIGRQCGRILILIGILVTGRPVTGNHAEGGPGPAPVEAGPWKRRRGSRRCRLAKLRGRTLGGGSCYCYKICQHSRPMHGSAMLTFTRRWNTFRGEHVTEELEPCLSLSRAQS